MKYALQIKRIAWSIGTAVLLLSILVALFQPGTLTAQEEDAAALEKAKVRLSYFKDSNGIRSLRATVTTKVDKKWQPAVAVPLGFYEDSIAPERLITQMSTDREGMATATIGEEHMSMDTSGFMHFVVAIDPNERFEQSDRDIEVKDLDLSATYEVEDTIHNVVIRAAELGRSGETRPVPKLKMEVFVKRTFGMLKIDEGRTDRKGVLEVVLPMDIPGDADGSLEIIPKLDDHDEYGTVVATCIAQCGVPLQTDISRTELRELWSPNAPLWMMITFVILMTIVWGHFYFFIYLLYRIRRIGSNGPERKINWEP